MDDLDKMTRKEFMQKVENGVRGYPFLWGLLGGVIGSFVSKGWSKEEDIPFFYSAAAEKEIPLTFEVSKNPDFGHVIDLKLMTNHDRAFQSFSYTKFLTHKSPFESNVPQAYPLEEGEDSFF